MYDLRSTVFYDSKKRFLKKYLSKGYDYVSFQMGSTGRVTASPGMTPDIRIKRGCREHEVWDTRTGEPVKVPTKRNVVVEIIDGIYYVDEDHMKFQELMDIIPMPNVFQGDGWMYIVDQEVLEELADQFEWKIDYKEGAV